MVIQTPEGDKIECMIRLDFPTTNNEAKYEALVASLDLARAAGAKNIIIHYDWLNGDYECRNERMKKYLEEVKSRINGLEVKFVQIPREENKCVDCLAKVASVEFMNASVQVLSFVQTSSLIDDKKQMQEINVKENWTTPLLAYLQSGTLLDGKDAARKLKVRASRFVLIRDVLYKRGFSRPYLRCLSYNEADYVMREVHEGICGNHSRARSLVHKLIRLEYY